MSIGMYSTVEVRSTSTQPRPSSYVKLRLVDRAEMGTSNGVLSYFAKQLTTSRASVGRWLRSIGVEKLSINWVGDLWSQWLILLPIFVFTNVYYIYMVSNVTKKIESSSGPCGVFLGWRYLISCVIKKC